MQHQELSIGPNLIEALRVSLDRLLGAKDWVKVARVIHAAMGNSDSRSGLVRAISDFEIAGAQVDALIWARSPSGPRLWHYTPKGGEA